MAGKPLNLRLLVSELGEPILHIGRIAIVDDDHVRDLRIA
jgi:hypothetical protein